MWQMVHRSQTFEGLRRSGTATNDTAFAHRRDSATGYYFPAKVRAYGTTVCGPYTSTRSASNFPRLACGGGRKPRAAQLSGEGKTPRHLWMLAGRKVPVTPTLSRKRSEEYIEALISQ